MTGDDNNDSWKGKTLAELYPEHGRSYVYEVHTNDYIYNIFYRRPRVIDDNRHTAASARALSAYLAGAYLGEESPEEAKAKIGVEEGYRRLEQISAPHNLRGRGIIPGQVLSGALSGVRIPRERPITVEELLRWFGVQTRSIYTNRVIRKALLRNNLYTEPALRGLALDDEIEICGDMLFITSDELAFRTKREEEARCRIKFEFVTARLAAWIDHNPGVGETEIRVKKAELDITGFDELSSDESADQFSLYTRLVHRFNSYTRVVLGMDQKNGHSEGSEQLKKIAMRLRKDETVELVTVRKLLAWFGTARRSAYVNYIIRDALRINNLRTEPDWSEQSLDGKIGFQEGAKIDEIDVPIVEQLCLEFFFDRLEGWMDENPGATLPEIQARVGVLNEAQFDEVANSQSAQIIDFPVQTLKTRAGVRKIKKEDLLPVIELNTLNSVPDIDPTSRIGELRSARVRPPRVPQEKTIAQAINIIGYRNHPVPIMKGERVIGAVSMLSIAMYINQGGQWTDNIQKCQESEEPLIKSSDTPLLDVRQQIGKREYVLIRDAGGKISGMVTSHDIMEEISLLAEPHLLIGEIEWHIRMLIRRGRFTNEELSKDEKDEARVINDESDLTIGEYIRLLEVKENWARLAVVGKERVPFINELKTINEIRRGVAHHRSKVINPDDFVILREFAWQLRQLRNALRPAEAC